MMKSVPASGGRSSCIRHTHPPGSPGTTMSGNGSWYLELEAQDGSATAHYRFQVSREQYNRYQEGQRVRLTLANEELRDIRPLF